MAILENALFPLIWIMQRILDSIADATGSWGLAIVTLSLFMRLPILPISRFADRLVAAEQQKQLDMAPELADAKSNFSGRKQFEVIESIYQRHEYHPIQSLKLSLPLALQIPFLLSALFLLVDHPSLTGSSFLFIASLSEPDALLPVGGDHHINLLPVALTLIALLEARIRPGANVVAQRRFAILTAVIAILIYSLPAAVCLYWTASNLWSVAGTAWRKHAQPTAHGSRL